MTLQNKQNKYLILKSIQPFMYKNVIHLPAKTVKQNKINNQLKVLRILEII